MSEMPDDQVMAAFALKTAGLGNITTTTMRALSEDEFAEIAAKLP